MPVLQCPACGASYRHCLKEADDWRCECRACGTVWDRDEPDSKIAMAVPRLVKILKRDWTMPTSDDTLRGIAAAQARHQHEGDTDAMIDIAKMQTAVAKLAERHDQGTVVTADAEAVMDAVVESIQLRCACTRSEAQTEAYETEGAKGFATQTELAVVRKCYELATVAPKAPPHPCETRLDAMTDRVHKMSKTAKTREAVYVEVLRSPEGRLLYSTLVNYPTMTEATTGRMLEKEYRRLPGAEFAILKRALEQ